MFLPLESLNSSLVSLKINQSLLLREWLIVEAAVDRRIATAEHGEISEGSDIRAIHAAERSCRAVNKYHFLSQKKSLYY